MPELSLHHIDQIYQDISRQEITFSHLLDELIDHVCCDVEDEMKGGLPFNDAYKKVKQKMGHRRLKEIQEETLYAVDTKYRYMKNLMKISGVAGTVLLGFAALFKINHWPGAGIMMTTGAFVLAFIFLPSALGVLWKETHSRKRLFLFISSFVAGMLFIFGVLFKIQHWPGAGMILTLAGFIGILCFIPALLMNRLSDEENKTKKPAYILGVAGAICYAAGMLFKIQHWPGAGLLMVIGLIVLFVIALPLYTWLTWKDDNNVSARFIFIVTGSLAIIIPAALINLNLSRSYDVGYYIHLQEQQAVFDYKFKQNKSVIEGIKDSIILSTARKIDNKTTDLINLIADGERNMVAESEGKPGLPVLNPPQIIRTASGQAIDYNLLTRPFNPDPVKAYLLSGCKYRQDLITALKNYSDYLIGLTSDNELKEYVKLLDPAICIPGENTPESSISLMSGLHSLMLIKNSILTVEKSAIVTIARK